MSGRTCVSTTPVWHSETHNSSGHCALRFLEPNTHSEDDDHRDTTNWVSIFFHLSAFVAAFCSAVVPAFVSLGRSPNLIRSDLVFVVERANLRAEYVSGHRSGERLSNGEKEGRT